ncbi:MAG: pantetheine-phosphate adenylyltransferase [Anaerolineales bacterium]|nr:pantetheine-phosphate adenylyltransferase [Anaerolineales bacterium]MBS3751826.1 pantetheine-phosphate adenylyltransferase [Anaerolineales bacterium]
MIRAVFPGTFDPVHYGHIDIAKRAARLFDEVVVAVYDQPLKRLLFSPQERIELVEKSLNSTENLKVSGYSGLTVDFCHEIDAQVIVRGLRVFSDFEYEFRMALTNERLAPDIEVVAFITNKDHTFLSGSTVREVASLNGDVSSFVPEIVEKALKKRFKELGSDQNIVPQSSLRD